MLLERIDPFLAEFDRVSKQVFGNAHGVGMPMDVTRRGDELVLHIDLPGVPADGIDVTVEDRTLTVTAERHTSYGDDEQVLVQERFDGTITRRLRVPDWVDAGRVSAEQVDGVLTVRLPLAEQARPRRVQVRTGSAGTARTQIDTTAEQSTTSSDASAA